MEIHEIPPALQTRLRLAVVSALITGEKTFSELKAITQSTDGNLSVQLSKLEEYSCVTCCKEFVEKRPKTSYALTTLGKEQFFEYVKMLERLLQAANEQPSGE